MTEQEIVSKNLILSTEFDRYVLEHPELCRINIELAEQQKEDEQQVVYIHIGSVSPHISRLKNVSLEVKVA
jgi:hypothetical protein